MSQKGKRFEMQLSPTFRAWCELAAAGGSLASFFKQLAARDIARRQQEKGLPAGSIELPPP